MRIRKTYNQLYYQKNKVKRLAQQKEWKHALKLKVLTHYGGGKLACVECGINDPDVLCIDHINNDRHISEFRGKRGLLFYQKLHKLRFPEGYQTLCANCNLKKEIALRR